MFKAKNSDENSRTRKPNAVQEPSKVFDYVTVTVKRADVERGHPTYETILAIVQSNKDYSRLPISVMGSGYAGVLETSHEPYSVTREFKTYRSLCDRIANSQKT